VEGLRRACGALDGPASGADAKSAAPVGGWFRDVPQPAKAKTNRPMSNSRFPDRFRKVPIVLNLARILFDLNCWPTIRLAMRL
jgi:hypothetical protein